MRVYLHNMGQDAACMYVPTAQTNISTYNTTVSNDTYFLLAPHDQYNVSIEFKMIAEV